jgi:hypothetical protein
MQGRLAPLARVGKDLDSVGNPGFSQIPPLRHKGFQRLNILRKLAIPNFYLDGLWNIRRLGSEKFGKRGIFNFCQTVVEVSYPFAEEWLAARRGRILRWKN